MTGRHDNAMGIFKVFLLSVEKCDVALKSVMLVSVFVWIPQEVMTPFLFPPPNPLIVQPPTDARTQTLVSVCVRVCTRERKSNEKQIVNMWLFHPTCSWKAKTMEKGKEQLLTECLGLVFFFCCKLWGNRPASSTLGFSCFKGSSQTLFRSS